VDAVGACHGVQLGAVEGAAEVGVTSDVGAGVGAVNVTSPGRGVGAAVAPPGAVHAAQARVAKAPTTPSRRVLLGRPAMVSAFPPPTRPVFTPVAARWRRFGGAPSGTPRFATPGHP